MFCEDSMKIPKQSLYVLALHHAMKIIFIQFHELTWVGCWLVSCVSPDVYSPFDPLLPQLGLGTSAQQTLTRGTQEIVSTRASNEPSRSCIITEKATSI